MEQARSKYSIEGKQGAEDDCKKLHMTGRSLLEADVHKYCYASSIIYIFCLESLFSG